MRNGGGNKVQLYESDISDNQMMFREYVNPYLRERGSHIVNIYVCAFYPPTLVGLLRRRFVLCRNI